MPIAMGSLIAWLALAAQLPRGVGAGSCTPWPERLSPSATDWHAPRLPERLVVALGRASDYAIDRGARDISSHTNPAIFATERATGRKVVLKLRLNAFKMNADGSVTVPSGHHGFPELEANFTARLRRYISAISRRLHFRTRASA